MEKYENLGKHNLLEIRGYRAILGNQELVEKQDTQKMRPHPRSHILALICNYMKARTRSRIEARIRIHVKNHICSRIKTHIQDLIETYQSKSYENHRSCS